eukprot:3410266-Amphidinium_carterae.2
MISSRKRGATAISGDPMAGKLYGGLTLCKQIPTGSYYGCWSYQIRANKDKQFSVGLYGCN